jgi:hypothetical protein
LRDERVEFPDILKGLYRGLSTHLARDSLIGLIVNPLKSFLQVLPDNLSRDFAALCQDPITGRAIKCVPIQRCPERVAVLAAQTLQPFLLGIARPGRDTGRRPEQ